MLLDDGGNDVHLLKGIKGGDGGRAGIGLAFAHNCSISLFVNIGGNDDYSGFTAGLGASANRSVAMFIDVHGDDAYRGVSKSNRLGFTTYDPRFSVGQDGTGIVNDVFGPHGAYLTSIGLFLDVGGNDTYWNGFLNGAVWGDQPGSDNWRVRNVGIGMDVPDGAIDWRPLSAAKDR